MKKYWWAGLLLLAWPVVVKADGMVIYPPTKPVYETGQKAVIWYDGKRETMVISTTFKGNAEDFAWVIPVPAKPEVNQGRDELFTSLNDFTQPKYRTYESTPLMGLNSISYDAVKAPTVTVIETKKIDIYDVTVLEATNGTALREWLVKNGYEYPTNRDYLLQYYIDKKWYFVAAKVTTDALGYVGAGLKEGHATPLAISFDWPTIIYPLKISGPGSKFNEVDKVGAFGFEQGVEGWTYGTVVSDLAWEGTKSIKVTSVYSTGDSNVIRTVSGLKPGTKYVLSGYVNVKEPTTGEVYLKVTGSATYEALTAVSLAGIQGWKRLNLVFTPQSENNLTLYLVISNVPPGKSVYFDGVQLEKGTTPTAFKEEVFPAFGASDNQLTGTLENGNVSMLLYIFANHKKTIPGFTADFAGNVSAKEIEKMAINDDGTPWIKAGKSMYLTKLSRYMTQAQMTDDLIVRDADDNTAIGGAGTMWDGWLRPAIILTVPIVAELVIVGWFWYSKTKKRI